MTAFEAQKRGLSCGVGSEKTAKSCSVNTLGPCSDDYICNIASELYGGKKVWRGNGPETKEAKTRGLTCGVNKPCSEDPTSCSYSELCDYAIWDHRKAHVSEANRRNLSCSVPLDIRQAFISQSKLKRQQLQYALKKLNFYSYGIDGLWGKGTKAGFEGYVDNFGLKGKSESEVFGSLLSRVSVPSSFASPKRTTSTSKSYYKGMTPIISNPSVSAEQAWAICAPQADLAGSNAANAYSSRSRSVDCNIIGRSVFCDSSSGGGGL